MNIRFETHAYGEIDVFADGEMVGRVKQAVGGGFWFPESDLFEWMWGRIKNSGNLRENVKPDMGLDGWVSFDAAMTEIETIAEEE